MTRTSELNMLPDPINRFIEAFNRSDAPGILSNFIDDAHVNDQLRDFWGLESIERWVKCEVVQDALQMTVLDAFSHYDQIIVEAELTGNFDSHGLPNPILVHFHFSMHGDAISQLLILCSRPADSTPEVRK